MKLCKKSVFALFGGEPCLLLQNRVKRDLNVCIQFGSGPYRMVVYIVFSRQRLFYYMLDIFRTNLQCYLLRMVGYGATLQMVTPKLDARTLPLYE